MHEEGDHATKNQLSGSRLQGDGLEKRLEQWECILHDQHGRLLPQRLANGPLCHHHFAQFRRKEGTPPPTHVAKKRNFKTVLRPSRQDRIVAHEARAILDHQDAVAELERLRNFATYDQLSVRLEQTEEFFAVVDPFPLEHTPSSQVTDMNGHV